MGFNTVAFMCNDLMSEIRKSPHTVVFMLTHPPMSDGPEASVRFENEARMVADRHGEPHLSSQALRVLSTFHADFPKFFVAGGNTITELKVLRRGKTKDGKETVTLELPEMGV